METGHEAPQDFLYLLSLAENVARYKGIYTKGIFFDTLGNHLRRGVSRIRNLPLHENIKQEAEEIFWVHDLPETILGDITTIEKIQKDINQETERKEEEVTRRILSDGRFAQYIQFKKASDAIKDLKTTTVLKPAAVLAKVVDIVDGNEFFHLSFTNWIGSDKYKPESIPPEKALIYTFDSYRKIVPNISSLKVDEEYRRLCKQIFDYELSSVYGFWQKIPTA